MVSWYQKTVEKVFDELQTSIFELPLRKNSLFSRNFFSNRFLWISIMLVHGTHVMCMHIGFIQNILKIQPVSLKQWFILFCIALLMIPTMELFKLIVRIASKKDKKSYLHHMIRCT